VLSVEGRSEGSRKLKTKITVLTLSAMLFALCSSTEAQQSKKLYRVGYLAPAASPSVEAFRESLRALGYVEGQNILIEWRFTKGGDTSQFPGLAAELVRLKVDCIVSTGIPAIRAAKQVTSTIPIVMNVADDPVEMGLIESLARPGGNITGYTGLGAGLSGKRLEILKEAFPKVARVGHLWTGLSGMANVREIEVPARALRLQVKAIEMKGPDDLEKSFRAAAKETEALIISGGGWMNGQRARVANQAAKTRLPVIYPNSQFLLAG
jgi:putative ABC transport system substrate-binding protein